MDNWNTLKLETKKLEKLLENQISSFDVEGQNKLGQIEKDYEKLKGNINRLKELCQLHSVLNSTINKAHLSRLDDQARTFRSKLYSLNKKKKESDRKVLFGDLSKEGANSEQDMLLRERFALQNSKSRVDELLEEASFGLGGLKRQRAQLGNVGTRLQGVGKMFPGLGKLMKRIQDKKTRDNTILALVIAFCISFIVIYELHNWGL
eukprot:snap_masked-scaffold_6-processed-gene-10.25-mRNA-1 protein AED:1.00 eAED:1.00 QI:0/-1/0/0/-1/1/1/0/205